jgi:RND family efflux transporter MFP subunit
MQSQNALAYHPVQVSFTLSTRVAVLLLILGLLSQTSQGEDWISFTQPVHRIELAAKESGRIEEVLVKKGDEVRAGQVLIRLDDDLHRIGQRLAECDAKDNSHIEQLRIELESYQTHAKNVRRLYDSGATSPEELREADLKVATQEIALQSAQNDSAQKQLRLEEANTRLERRLVRTPLSGVVVDVIAHPGEYVSTATPHLMTLVQLDRLRCTFFLDTDAASSLTVGQSVALEFDSARRSPVMGEVEHISAVTEADSGLVSVDVMLNNDSRQWRAGRRVRLLSLQPVVTRSSARTSPSLNPPLSNAPSALTAPRISVSASHRDLEAYYAR